MRFFGNEKPLSQKEREYIEKADRDAQKKRGEEEYVPVAEQDLSWHFTQQEWENEGTMRYTLGKTACSFQYDSKKSRALDLACKDLGVKPLDVGNKYRRITDVVLERGDAQLALRDVLREAEVYAYIDDKNREGERTGYGVFDSKNNVSIIKADLRSPLGLTLLLHESGHIGDDGLRSQDKEIQKTLHSMEEKIRRGKALSPREHLFRVRAERVADAFALRVYKKFLHEKIDEKSFLRILGSNLGYCESFRK